MSAFRRMKPALGTFVGIEVAGGERETLIVATERAFAEILKIHTLMSFHEEASDVSRLNRDAAQAAVQVDAHTFEVLESALKLSRESDGVFDITVASTLVKWGLLPAHEWSAEGSEGRWQDIELLPDRRVRFARPLQVDLGGIAKGYAVDCAVGILQSFGVSSGIVNAGGDLRVFGDQAQMIYVRDPADPQRSLPLGEIGNEAVATSAPCFSFTEHAGQRVSHFVNTRNGNSFVEDESVSVIAPRCMDADALTKVVLFSPDRATDLLSLYGARVVRLSTASVAVSQLD